jgi:hypothetical protein
LFSRNNDVAGLVPIMHVHSKPAQANTHRGLPGVRVPAPRGLGMIALPFEWPIFLCVHNARTSLQTPRDSLPDFSTPRQQSATVPWRKNSGLYGPERFTYLPESNSYRCPAGEQLNCGVHNARNRTHVYIGTRKRCGGCAQKAMHQFTAEIPRHPHPRTRPTTRSRLGQHARLPERTTGKEEGGSAVRGTQESGLRRLRLAEIEICSRAVLTRGSCPGSTAGCQVCMPPRPSPCPFLSG